MLKFERGITDPHLEAKVKILQGIFFLPVTKFPIIIDFSRNEFCDLLPGKKQEFDRIFQYFTENYLNNDADFENFDNSTNFVESLNFVLKKIVHCGTVSFKKAC